MFNNLSVQDFITAGVFSAILLIVAWISGGIISFIPVLMLISPIVMMFFDGIPFMVLLTRVDKFGVVTLLGIILGLLCFLTGNTWIPIITATVFSVIADYILKLGNYSSSKHSIIAYGVFSLVIMGNMLPIYVMRDTFRQYLTASNGAEYTNIVLSMAHDWVLPLLFIGVFLGGICGALLGKKILNKHLEKSGIV